MSVVVRMEMPENCAVCPFVTEYSRCVFLGMFAIDEERRADKCPIICSLPEVHGDLVEAKEITVNVTIKGKKCSADVYATTIVPAERREE